MNGLDVAVALGALTGLSAVAAWRLARPAPPPLPVALARLSAPPASTPDAPGTRAGRWTLAHLGVRDTGHKLAADLRLLGRAPADHAAAKALAALVGGLIPPAWAALAAVAGVPVSATTTGVAAVALAAAGFVLPDGRVRAEAAQRRRDFVAALGSFLDLVVIALAGGAGVEGALRSAAGVGRGWAFTRLRDTLHAAQFNGTNVWTALGQLGTDLNVAVLEEVAASMALAGTEGARVRDSLAAKTAALRERQLSEAEAAAQSATERMAVPTVLLLAGFMVLIGYPAVDAVLNGI